MRSSVLPGSGLSSSAAFEALIGTICNELFFDRKLSPVEIAQVGQYAENVYFGKPCGLMDQTASSVGGMVFIDFENPDSPVVERIDFDFSAAGHALCIIDSGADHADLTEEYAAIPGELKDVCTFFGKEVLQDIPEADFFAALPELRHRVPDRAILRAVQFYQENKRVQRQAQALRDGDFDTFLDLVSESGRSSWMYLQNITPPPVQRSIRMWRWRWHCAICCFMGSGLSGCTAAASPERFRPLCRWRCWIPSKREWNGFWAKENAISSPSAARAASGKRKEVYP